jgi:hypothetical protein
MKEPYRPAPKPPILPRVKKMCSDMVRRSRRPCLRPARRVKQDGHDARAPTKNQVFKTRAHSAVDVNQRRKDSVRWEAGDYKQGATLTHMDTGSDCAP